MIKTANEIWALLPPEIKKDMQKSLDLIKETGGSSDVSLAQTMFLIGYVEACGQLGRFGPIALVQGIPIAEALKHLSPGGRVVINAIRKEEADKEILTKLDYPSQLWMEKEIKSVANVTRQDVREFLQLAAGANIKPEFQEFDLKDANAALLEMKQGKIRGAKVLRVS